VACLTFETLLAPFEGAHFLQQILGQSALYIAGDSDKFSGLSSWRVLNHLLKFGGMGHPRLRLIGGGQELPADSYLRQNASGYPRIIVPALNAALGNGAILAIESIEDLHEPISGLCDALERRLEVPVQADLYAYCRAKAPQPLRWNEHDVMVLQLEGEQELQVHCPTATYPTANCFPPEPKSDPAWNGSLRPGDLLYVPRGWWYSDQTAEPGLCLAVKFRNPSGLDVLQRLVGLLTRSNAMREDCPRFGGPERQSAFIRAFQAEVMMTCTSGGLLLGFLNDFKNFSESRMGFNLPWSVAADPLPPSDDLLVLPLLRFPREGSVRHAVNEDAAEIIVEGTLTRFPEATGKVLARICNPPTLSVSGLLEAFASQIPREQVLGSLAELVKLGVVELRESDITYQ
jgi:hypothetical protein